ncbi:MAG: FHA domain-containing protein, partial [Myxococcota bacterium]|nr:FHA domain-containing protein [Myxococcota bacterium]
MPLHFGKEHVVIGSAADNDVVIAAAGVAPHHARIALQNGLLFFVDGGVGPSTANGAPIAPGQSIAFDFRTVFGVGAALVPLGHPAICAMLMSPGQVQPPPGQVVVGRDPKRASLVIAHAAVSGFHATVMLDRMTVVDHGSTSGTWVAGQRVPPNQPAPLEAGGVVAFGPVPVPVSVLPQLAQLAQEGKQVEPARAAAS